MTIIKVSVVIPVYNAKDYLHDCIKSLLSQTLVDCEFIFVNDGSTDNSLEIIQKYQEEDNRINLISQKNKGIAEARNAGIEIASGQYIGFLDNDDFVKIDFFENLYKNAIDNNLDILVSKTILGRDGKYIIKDHGFSTNLIFTKDMIQEQILPNLLKVEDLFAVWNKIYKRTFVFENNIRFPGNRVIEEDNMFNIKSFNKAEKVLFIDYAGYYYRDVANSKSRKTIENDYFYKALEKYYFDYKKEYDLSISDDELEKLKAIRFVQRVFYLVYKCSVLKIQFKTKWNYIKNMVFHEKVYELSKKYNEEILQDKGLYERIALKIIIKKESFLLVLLILSIQLVYHPKISETIRKINKLTKKR
ncbi:glycosyltransferase [Flavobacterium tyrosinilyticum]|uniref:glycosyltransferase n=1 Tax=Flavobacterium tyrosinilyticum TaxID=1658740 RepID=UPI00202F7298|nr:glycosyltransferase [Flavobacterium tyrosinilyticum]MCM0665435.1 glycosyltransferase [Flavobacterium tyrosinilyticum]